MRSTRYEAPWYIFPQKAQSCGATRSEGTSQTQPFEASLVTSFLLYDGARFFRGSEPTRGFPLHPEMTPDSTPPPSHLANES